MKRGSFVAKRKPLNRVSAKVQASRPEFDAVYTEVDVRSGGRCEVVVAGRRCPARAVEHHHLKKPRRIFHRAECIAHVCRRDHDQASAAYATGRLLFHELRADGQGWDCVVCFKASKWA